MNLKFNAILVLAALCVYGERQQLQGSVCGTVALKELDHETAELKALYLDRELRGRGYGRRLISSAVSFAREHGYQKILLDSMSQYTDASRLYKRYGFTDTDRYNDNIYADVFMQMILR